jgi:hypothetical protein
MGARNACKTPGLGGGMDGVGPEGAVDVKPEAMGLGDPCKRFQIVKGADIDRARAGRDHERRQAGGAVGGDRPLQRLEVHAKLSVERDQPQGL